MQQWPDCYWSESLSSTCRLTKPLSPPQPLSQKAASVFTFDNCVNEQACLLRHLNLGILGKRWLPNKPLRWSDETVRMGLNLHVLVSGHFLLAVQPWPAGADLATQADRHGRTHTRTHPSCQTATPPRRESAICLHHVPLQNPLIHSPSSSLFFSHLSVITRDRAWADGSLLNRCFVRQTTHILCRSNSNRPARSCIWAGLTDSSHDDVCSKLKWVIFFFVFDPFYAFIPFCSMFYLVLGVRDLKVKKSKVKKVKKATRTEAPLSHRKHCSSSKWSCDITLRHRVTRVRNLWLMFSLGELAQACVSWPTRELLRGGTYA